MCISVEWKTLRIVCSGNNRVFAYVSVCSNHFFHAEQLAHIIHHYAEQIYNRINMIEERFDEFC